jgi:hypothetical protein
VRRLPSRAQLEELRDLLCAWDPIGVIEYASRDEYDCVMSPLLVRLRRGESPEQIGLFLNEMIRHHFGLDPMRDTLPGRTNVLATEAKAWYARVMQ